MVGVALATVDLERAARALGELAFGPAPDDELLGAHAVGAMLRDGVPLFLLEPSREGRLAAFLARHGEGPVALYLTGDPRASAAPTQQRGCPLGRPAWLQEGAPRWGPFLVDVAPAAPARRVPRVEPPGATIEPMAAGTIDLRPARPSDAEAIAALFTDEGYPAGPSDIVERLARFESDYSTVRVASISGEVVGFVAVHVMPRFEHSDRIARVLALVVDAGVRERGLGHTLMTEAERIARETGCAFIEVTAGHHRPDALQLYEALGYDPAVASYLRKRL
ncbi:MAG: GNAT family N-acetyltransferase [Candidatus Limnocylindrales bacterium]